VTECRRCGGRAADAFLCQRCAETLRGWLRELPWWLERLTETAQGRTRMTDNGGRRSARRRDLDGDKELAACIEPLPDNPQHDLDKARRDRERAALAHALASGRINARASQLLGDIASGLGYWCRVLCEARGIAAPALAASHGAYGTTAVAWLAHNIAAVAQSEDAGDICTDVEGWLEDIAQTINRPVRWWPLGACPAETADGPCQAELPRVPEHTENVRCRDCGATHVVSRVLLIRKHEREGQPQTRRELVRYNADLPPEFQVPPRTLRDWLARGKLAPCGADPEGDPLYSWVDVRLLMFDSKHGSLRRRADNTIG
jgi:hypothetical protein